MGWLTVPARAGKWLLAAVKWLFQGGRWKATLAVAGALSALLLIAGVHHYRTEAKASERAAQAATDDNRVLTGAIKSADRAVTGNSEAKARIRARENTGLAATKAALDAHPDWANEPIPDDVLNSVHQGDPAP